MRIGWYLAHGILSRSGSRQPLRRRGRPEGCNQDVSEATTGAPVHVEPRIVDGDLEADRLPARQDDPERRSAARPTTARPARGNRPPA